MAFHDHLIQALRALTPVPLALRAVEPWRAQDNAAKLSVQWDIAEDGRPRARWIRD